MLRLRKRTPLIRSLEMILPLLYLTLILLVDSLTPFGTITPPFCVVGLLIMSYYIPPERTVFWAVIYSIVISAIFISPSLHQIFSDQPYPKDSATPVVRSATFVLAAYLASYLCFTLNKLRVMYSELQQILARIPLPVVTSDHNGKILYVNESAKHVLSIDEKKHEYMSYFDLLAPPEYKGRTIAEYLARLERESPRKPMDLEIRGRKINGLTQVLSSTGSRVLLTVLESREGRSVDA